MLIGSYSPDANRFHDNLFISPFIPFTRQTSPSKVVTYAVSLSVKAKSVTRTFRIHLLGNGSVSISVTKVAVSGAILPTVITSPFQCDLPPFFTEGMAIDVDLTSSVK
jgi:hypothetical protein